MGFLNLPSPLPAPTTQTAQLPTLQVQSAGCCNGGAEVLSIAHAFQEQMNSVVVAPPAPRALNEVGVIAEYFIDLGDLNNAGTAGLPFAGVGVKLIYARMGSNPGGRIDFASAGRVTQLYPGCIVDMPVNGGSLYKGAGSATFGVAKLILIKLAGYDFHEPKFTDVNPTGDNMLLGRIGPYASFANMFALSATTNTLNYAPLAKDSDPVNGGGNASYEFWVTGLSGIAVFIDTLSNAANATSFDLVPWFDPAGTGMWHEQGTERISVPDTDTTGGRYRCVTMKLIGSTGKMTFSIRNLLAAGRTGLGIFTVGI